MSIRPRSIVVPFAGILLAACATGTGQPEMARESRQGGGVEYRDGAIIISGVALDDGPGSVLSALQGKIPNMRVQRSGADCPSINLRSNVNYQGVVNPHVYVDGTRTTDTCVLESIRTEDVQLVEVYAQGFTRRPGYGTHAHGLILLFMRSQ
jgi:hypothetical protein